jgi:cytochrome c biogenesis protein CcdA/thiol-disulfide isomerase/thioredoxin
MLLLLLAYLGGALTILSPCILPVLPFVFARADRPFLTNGLPMLAGMAATFALVATLAAVGGGWAVEANSAGRAFALILLALFGVTLLFPEIADRLMQPIVRLGDRLSRTADAGGASVGTSLLLGVATGFLWAPCAGPILGLVLTGAALQGANATTTLALLAYALGAATSLGLALLIGGRVFAAMKRSLGVGEWVRRGLGAAVLAGVAVVALGLDAGFLTRISTASTTTLEQGLVDKLGMAKPEESVLMNAPAMQSNVVMNGPAMKSGDAMQGNVMMKGGDAPAMMMMKGGPAAAKDELPIEGPAPSLDGAVQWFNSPPLTSEQLKGKVVLVDFWTYSCINCLRAIPYTRAWAEKYRDQGLVVIGVHAPEFAFEKSLPNVEKAIKDLNIGYPVAVDNDYKIWRAFHNQYWPAHYFIDANGQIRHHHFGEGDYDGSERVIQQLLTEAGHASAQASIVKVDASGAEAAADAADAQSPETYVGYDRAENFVSPGGAAQDAEKTYAAGDPRLNEWGLVGDWKVGSERATLTKPDGAIVFRFHARDLHLVLAPSEDGKPVRFEVTIDGQKPGDSHGADTDANGAGEVSGDRLYQLVRQSGPVRDRTFSIRFLDPGVRAYAFTFG